MIYSRLPCLLLSHTSPLLPSLVLWLITGPRPAAFSATIPATSPLVLGFNAGLECLAASSILLGHIPVVVLT